MMMWGHILPQSSFWFKKARNSIVIGKRNKGIPPVKKTESKEEEMHPPQHMLPIANKRMSHPASCQLDIRKGMPTLKPLREAVITKLQKSFQVKHIN